MGTISAANAGVSVVHGVGLVIGGRYGIAHGIPHAILMAPAMHAFAGELADTNTALAAALGAADGDAVAAFDRLAAAAGLALSLRAIGVPQEDFSAIAEQAAALPIMQFAARTVAPAEIRSWLEARW
jgi:alcohol dehydrogenase class IV